MTRFIVDAMLGRLALWLRLTGNDTLYSADVQDNMLLNTAQKDSRVLLTSDEELYNRAAVQGIQTMLVRGNVDEQIASVFRQFNISPVVDPSLARCSKCNGKLIHLKGQEKERIRHLVHKQTFEYYPEFWLCEKCNSVYFQGGYWKNIIKYLKHIRDIM